MRREEENNRKEQWNWVLVLWENEQITKPLARLIKEKRKEEFINKIRNKKGEVINDSNKNKKKILRTTVNNYANKMDNLEEMKILRKIQSPKIRTRENRNYEQNNQRYWNAKWSKLTTNKTPRSDRFKGLIPSNIPEKSWHLLFWNSSPQLQRKEHSPTHSHKATITLTPKKKKPDKDHTKNI